MDLKEYIRSIPDYPKKGILFRDITTLIKNENAFSETINIMIEKLKKYEFDKITAIESRGFIFASPLSYNLNKSHILLRKKNKLPAERYSIDFELEYGSATLEIHKDSISPKEKVVIINLGGIANFSTLVSKTLLSSDIGPANCLTDDLSKYFFKKKFDKYGNYARKGKIDCKLIDIFKKDKFFRKNFPKVWKKNHFR